MHETFMASQIVKAIGPLMAPHRPGRLEAISLRVGPLLQAVPELLADAIRALLADSPDADAKVIVQSAPLAGTCQACGRNISLADWSWLCPACGSRDLSLDAGSDELTIETLTVRTDEPTTATRAP